MACASSLLTEEQFLCSICMDVFTNPAAIPCGHNFCLQCITNYWDTSNICQCPLCLEQFYKRPMLRVNIFIAEMAAKFKKTIGEKSSGSAEQQCAKPGSVLCDICPGVKLTALQSCLVCLMSYCATHLEPHQRIPALKKHKLIKPVENLESRMCKKHDKLLELFCKVDGIFVCESCIDTDHKTHEIVTLEEEVKIRKTQMEMTQEKMHHMIQERQQKINEMQHSVETSRNNADKALSYSTDVMSALVQYINRSQAELTKVFGAKKKKTETQAEDFIKELEGEIMQLKQESEGLQQVPLSEDHFKFLESFPPLSMIWPRTKDWSDIKIDSEEYTVETAVAQLERLVIKEIRMLCDPDLNKMQQHAVDVNLDPETAHPCITVSEDGKQVRYGDTKKKPLVKPQRFDNVLNVLAKEGFSSGKFYYEVQVKDKTQWDLGVAKESINRKGDIRLSPNNGYWTVWMRKGREYTANAGPAVILPLRQKPQKVGVFVDYEEGQVSFYDVEARAHMYTFTGCNFTEKLFPFFSPCGNDGGKNSAPLIITPVKYSG
ncbi:nuclear factor 7, brain-like [Myripristis murdjan]|uniref:nuclear factor 7, brain-like n=1 Tax=Myripristis murdjan TaxID=586833 RepID=UPI001176446D|nr:nuclear factor 7, brain-like [Myripristis murdjan]